MADKVLIVDDDPAVQKMLFKVMKSNGLEAFTASDGAEALELVRKNVYQLILMDINMSGLDGFEAVQTLRKNGCDVPIIIVSGRKEDYDTLYGLDIGADDYITKPFNPVTLGAKAK
ncbi:MAG: response regulator, partial [Oscillospiraceae bacterium]